MSFESERKEAYLKFDSLVEMLDYADSVPDKNHSKKYNKSDSFCNYTFAEVLETAFCGMPADSGEKFSALIEAVKSKLIAPSKKFKADFDGQSINIVRAIAGEPKAFLKRKPGGIKPKIRVYVNCSMNAGIPPDVIRTRGAAIMALVDELRFIYDVELLITWRVSLKYENWGTKNGENVDTFRVDVPITQGGQPLDLDACNFCLTHEGYLRRTMVAVCEKFFNRSHCSGYGRPSDLTLQPEPDEFILFPSSSHRDFRERDFRTPESAADYIAGVIEKHF